MNTVEPRCDTELTSRSVDWAGYATSVQLVPPVVDRNRCPWPLAELAPLVPTQIPLGAASIAVIDVMLESGAPMPVPFVKSSRAVKPVEAQLVSLRLHTAAPDVVPE